MRLVSRVDVNGFASGALQVLCKGAWGAVCTSNFDDRDALVACRQLGFTAGRRLPKLITFGRRNPDLVRQLHSILAASDQVPSCATDQLNYCRRHRMPEEL